MFILMRGLRLHFSMNLEFGSGRQGLPSQALGLGGVAKNSFSQMLGFWWFQCNCFMFFVGFGIHFDDFWCPGDRLENP